MARPAPDHLPPDSRIRFVTFGCKVNQYDTEVLRGSAFAGGWVETAGEADVIVVNTCTVTEGGGAAARKAVRRLARENPAARIYVTGCYAGSDPAAVSGLPGVVGVVPNDRRSELLDILDPDHIPGPFIERTVPGFRDRTRAFLKIQDGCHLRCSYCIIPRVRPAVTSKKPETVLREVREMVAGGHREIVITGVHVGGYGREGPDRGGRDALAALLRRVLRETDVPRVRLSSVEAFEVTPALARLYADEPRLAPHVHIPLQSGSARILRLMRRRYHPERFLRAIRRIRDAVPDAAVSTDVIVGFPGETDEDFKDTRDLLARAGIMRTHVFPWSPRRGTPATEMPDRVRPEEVRRRVHECEEVGEGLAREYAASRIGTVGESLFERRRIRGMLTGYTERYLRVFLHGPDEWMGRLAPVRILELAESGVLAERTMP